MVGDTGCVSPVGLIPDPHPTRLFPPTIPRSHTTGASGVVLPAPARPTHCSRQCCQRNPNRARRLRAASRTVGRSGARAAAPDGCSPRPGAKPIAAACVSAPAVDLCSSHRSRGRWNDGHGHGHEHGLGHRIYGCNGLPIDHTDLLVVAGPQPIANADADREHHGVVVSHVDPVADAEHHAFGEHNRDPEPLPD